VPPKARKVRGLNGAQGAEARSLNELSSGILNGTWPGATTLEEMLRESARSQPANDHRPRHK
jgi:hypothetical protein